MYFEYRIVKIEKGLFLIEYKTAPYGVWHEVKNKQFKTSAWDSSIRDCRISEVYRMTGEQIREYFNL